MKSTLIVIGGPTAAGKSPLAMNFARHLDTEIISADSRQCFKEMTIGTAKPPREDLEEMYYKPNERFRRAREIDTRKLVFNYYNLN